MLALARGCPGAQVGSKAIRTYTVVMSHSFSKASGTSVATPAGFGNISIDKWTKFILKIKTMPLCQNHYKQVQIQKGK
jgi:hypothetical protein